MSQPSAPLQYVYSTDKNFKVPPGHSSFSFSTGPGAPSIIKFGDSADDTKNRLLALENANASLQIRFMEVNRRLSELEEKNK